MNFSNKRVIVLYCFKFQFYMDIYQMGYIFFFELTEFCGDQVFRLVRIRHVGQKLRTRKRNNYAILM